MIQIRTLPEILRYYHDLESQDTYGFRRGTLLLYLTFDEAKPLLVPNAKPEAWGQHKLTEDQVIWDMRNYLHYAWQKVAQHQHLSCHRSIEKLEAWLWLLGDDMTLQAMKAAQYPQLGAPMLAVICQQYGFPIPESFELHNMITSRPCRFGCKLGCA
jgi:hypothetical protein